MLEATIDPQRHTGFGGGVMISIDCRSQDALRTSLSILRNITVEIDRHLSSNQQVAGVLLDYIMLYYELLELEIQRGSITEVVR